MDSGAILGMVRGTGTAVLLACFVVLCFWAWAPGRRQRFDEASRLPFLDEGDAARLTTPAEERLATLHGSER